MSIVIDVDLTQKEKRQLAGILGCDLSRLEQVLGPYAKAALEEYIRMFLGQAVFTRERISRNTACFS